MKKIFLFLTLLTLKLEALTVIEDGTEPWGRQKWQLILDQTPEDQAMQKNIDAFVALFPKEPDDLNLPTQQEMRENLFKAIVGIGNTSNQRITLTPIFWKKLTPLTFLRDIFIVNFNTDQVPESIGNLLELRELYLNYGNLTQIPDLSKLTSLRTLNLSQNNLSQIPELSKLTSLRTLDLSHNELSQIPELSKLTNLEGLYLNNNNLTQLPDLNSLTGLLTLHLQDNKLTTTPDRSSLKNLINFCS